MEELTMKGTLKLIKKVYSKPGLTVEVRNNNVDGAMRVLKKKLQNEGFYTELREREYHKTKGEKRRLAKAAGRKRHLKEVQKRDEEFGF